MSALRVTARDGSARTAILATAHGEVRLPAFMPVGTHATVKGCLPAEVRACGADIVLCNAYHLALRPGVATVQGCGGLHAMMGWDGPILTDSGGYQLVSLQSVAAVDDGGAVFVSPYDGTRVRISPEDAVRMQADLGADVLMCLDHPVAYGAGERDAVEATGRTHRWAERCRAAHPGGGRLLFGIVQGGFDVAARAESARLISGMDFDGVAIGGLALGEPRSVMQRLAGVCLEHLPDDLPRYVMGLGTDVDLLAMVGAGVDMFDCVLPTRLARTGVALTFGGRLAVRQSRWRDDVRPLEAGCPCPACTGGYSRAYLRHLVACGEMLSARLLSLHNLRHLGDLMSGARAAIEAGRLEDYRAQVAAGQAAGVDSSAASIAAAVAGGRYTSPP